MIFKELDLNKKDYYFLAFIIIISTILTSYYIIFSAEFGIFCSDVYVYLIDALYFTGHNAGATNFIWLSPIVCFIGSLFIDVGVRSSLCLFITTGLFAILGNIGLYLLFRYKFNDILSTLGVIIYSTTALYVIWLGNGTLDIPAVSLTIWTVLLVVLAIDKNPKYYPYAALVFILAFYTKYTISLIGAPLLIYFIYKRMHYVKGGLKTLKSWDREELKYIKRAILVAIISFVLILIPIAIMGNGYVGFFEQGSNMASGSTGFTVDPAHNVENLYYINYFPNFLSTSHTTFDNNNPVFTNSTVISYILMAFVVIGAAISLYDNRKTKLDKRFLIVSVVLIIASAYSFMNLKATDTIILLMLLFLSARLTSRKPKNDFNLMMFLWLLVYLSFFSYLHIKVNRYFLPAMPVVAYFMVYGVYKLQSKIKINEYIIPVILMCILIPTGFYYADTIEQTDYYHYPEQMADYIITQYPDYQDMYIGSGAIRPFEWYLAKDLKAMHNNEIEKIEGSGVQLYISNKEIKLNNYTEVKNIGDYYLYEKI